VAAASGAGDDPVERLAALACTPRTQVREWLADRFGADQVDEAINRYEGELAYLLLADPLFRAGLTRPGLAAFAAAGPPEAASSQLRAALAGLPAGSR